MNHPKRGCGPVYDVRAAFAWGTAGFPLSPEKDSGSCTSGRSIENTHAVPGMLRTSLQSVEGEEGRVQEIPGAGWNDYRMPYRGN
jgi:hypothetical protein